MNFNDYYNYLNGYDDMNFMPNTNQMIDDLNYQNLMSSNTVQSNDILDSEEGFKRGNMFKDLYDQYKNYKPSKLKATSEREDMLMQIQEYSFAMIDMGLLLDINSDDKRVLKLFNDYLRRKKELVNMYEGKYGPLTFDSDDQKSSWRWDNSPWPWEVQK